MSLPPEYVNYLAGDGHKEGELTMEPGWFQLWPPAEVERWNQEYHVQEFAPGFLGFGSSGGGELLAFDTNGHVVMLPMVGMSADDSKIVADSWNDFVEKIVTLP